MAVAVPTVTSMVLKVHAFPHEASARRTTTAIEADTPDLTAAFDQSLKTHSEGLASAVRTAEEHFPQGGLCSCFRPLPCGVRQVLDRRREDYERSLAALFGPTGLIPVVIEEAPPPAEPSRRSWWSFRRRRSSSAVTA